MGNIYRLWREKGWAWLREAEFGFPTAPLTPGVVLPAAAQSPVKRAPRHSGGLGGWRGAVSMGVWEELANGMALPKEREGCP